MGNVRCGHGREAAAPGAAAWTGVAIGVDLRAQSPPWATQLCVSQGQHPFSWSPFPSPPTGGSSLTGCETAAAPSFPGDPDKRAGSPMVGL